MTGQAVVFGQNPNQTYRAFRYTDALGLDRDEVMNAIRTDIQPQLPLPLPPPNNAPLIGLVTVNGLRFRYRAFPVSKDLVNVGSITIP